MKYLLDTCVVSEMAKKVPDKNVSEWLGGQKIENLYLSWLTVGELQKGVSKQGDTVKGRLLTRWLKTAVLGRYVGRIIAVEQQVATEWGRICGEAERVGNRRPQVDSLIAATAVAHKMTLVTRNVRDMEGTGATLLNPFASDKTI